MKTFIGFISGIVATGPMTAMMVIGHKHLPRSEQYSLPPGEIVKELGEKAGVAAVGQKSQRGATLGSHFAYGAMTGAIYAVTEEKLPAKPVLKGMAFGLLVWTVSYLGVMPALNVLKPATQHPSRRNALMIGAHLLWGATLGGFVDLLKRESERLSTELIPNQDAAS
jgi:uncharacterized membrane protein YagU involved in acid resistance